MLKNLNALLLRIIKDPFIIIKFLIRKVRSYYFSRLIDDGNGKIIISDPFLSIQIKKSKNAKITIDGNFRISKYLGGTSPVRVNLGENSKLNIYGDFVIGNGVKIYIGQNAELNIGGKRFESDSGITMETLIMVNKKVTIGNDFICAWNVFISDSDWHQINNQPFQADIIIGDHVWIANSCSVLKGTVIGNNCILASHSKVINKTYPSNSMLAGTPASVVRNNINWKRDV